MHCELHILVCCAAWLAGALGYPRAAKVPVDTVLLKKFAKNVETVLSPTLIGELQGAQSNRSAVNVALTAPRDREPPPPNPEATGKTPEIQFDNQIYPYHYERSFYYQYPPPYSPSTPSQYSSDFYRPSFRSKINYPPSNFYRPDWYHPYPPSDIAANPNPVPANAQSSSNANVNANSMSGKLDGNGPPPYHPPPLPPAPHPTPLPPNAFVSLDLYSPPPRSEPFPNVEFDRFRHSVLNSPESRDYFRPIFDNRLSFNDKYPDTSLYQNSISPLAPRGPPLLPPPYPPPPPPPPPYNPHQNTAPQPASYSSHLPPPPPPPGSVSSPLFGSFRNQGYIYPPSAYNYRPSEHLNGLFGDNFTRNFPSPPFGGFDQNRSPVYQPPNPPAPQAAASRSADAVAQHNTPPPPPPPPLPMPMNNQESKQDKMNKQEETAPASSSTYEMKFLMPSMHHELDFMFRPHTFRQFTYTTKKYRV